MACVYGISIHINTYRHTFRFYALSRNGFVGSFFAADRFSSDYKPENVFILSNFVANTAHTHTQHTLTICLQQLYPLVEAYIKYFEYYYA